MGALMHVTDWLPTLLSIAGTQPSGSLSLDGYDQSNNIVMGEMDTYHPREEILHNVILHEATETDGSSSSCYDEFCGAIRWRDYKLVVGTDNVMTHSDDDSTDCLNSWCETAVREESVSSHSVQCHESYDNYQFPEVSGDFCLFNGGACLFNVMDDPCEWTDIRESNMDIYNMLLQKLHDYNNSQSFPLFRVYPENGSLANPDQFGGFWSPWYVQL